MPPRHFWVVSTAAKHSARRSVLYAAVWVVRSFPLIGLPVCPVLLDQSYDLVVIDGRSL